MTRLLTKEASGKCQKSIVFKNIGLKLIFMLLICSLWLPIDQLGGKYMKCIDSKMTVKITGITD